MQRVNIWTSNHYSTPGIQDTVLMIRNGARDAGWDAWISDRIVPGCINLTLEHFIEPETIAYMRSRKTPGTRLVVVCTEVISPQGFNCDLNAGDDHYANAEYWRDRHRGFLAVAEFADELWVLSPQQIAAYRAVLPGRPVRYLPHGWVPEMDRVQHLDERDKDIDFFFSGSLTPDRTAVMEALAVRHRVAFSPQGAPDYLRLDLLARTKVCLSLPLSVRNRLPSVSRIHYHLQNRNFVLQQQYAERCALDPYVLHAPADDYVEWARAALDIPTRREIAEGANLRFRTECRLAPWIDALLRGEATAESDGPEAGVEAARAAQPRFATSVRMS